MCTFLQLKVLISKEPLCVCANKTLNMKQTMFFFFVPFHFISFMNSNVCLFNAIFSTLASPSTA